MTLIWLLVNLVKHRMESLTIKPLWCA